MLLLIADAFSLYILIIFSRYKTIIAARANIKIFDFSMPSPSIFIAIHNYTESASSCSFSVSLKLNQGVLPAGLGFVRSFKNSLSVENNNIATAPRTALISWKARSKWVFILKYIAGKIFWKTVACCK